MQVIRCVVGLKLSVYSIGFGMFLALRCFVWKFSSMVEFFYSTGLAVTSGRGHAVLHCEVQCVNHLFLCCCLCVFLCKNKTLFKIVFYRWRHAAMTTQKLHAAWFSIM